MKINTVIEIDGTEILNAYVGPLFKRTQLNALTKDIQITVYSDTQKKWIEFDPKKILFVWKTPDESPKTTAPTP